MLKKKTNKKVKFIFITGGVLSSLGKGITAACLGALFEARGYKVALKKFDPYLNFSTSSMSPIQHGEIFVTDDGAEGDLDLGHYERFTVSKTNQFSDLTSGKIYYSVIEKERRGEYLGSTIQVIPHITDEIKWNISQGIEDCDIVIVEIGGTVGDIESLPFLEAIRQMRFNIEEEESNDTLFIHLTLIPYIKSAGEVKTKPTQHSVKKLQEIGISPDILVCRSEQPLSDSVKSKLALFCNVDKKAVINCIDAPTIYQVPLILHEEGIDSVALSMLGLPNKKCDLSKWNDILSKMKNPKDKVTIAIIGKYLETKDSYLSIIEALKHAGLNEYLEINIKWVDAEDLEKKEASLFLEDVDGILIPTGFGERGVEGMVNATKFARMKDIPFLGLSLGMSVAIVEFARNILKLNNAKTAEMVSIKNNKDMVVNYRENGKGREPLMRLGAYKTTIKDGTLAARIYDELEVSERHRHRLELNNKYRESLEDNGMIVSGENTELGLADIIELQSHRFFIATEFLPEFQSKPFKAHPLFSAFVQASFKFKQDRD